MATPKTFTPTDLATQILPFTANANSLVEQAERAVIDSKESLDKATDFIKLCIARRDRSEELRVSLVKPLNNHVAWINDQFRPVRERIEKAKEIVNKKAVAFQKAETERLEREAAEEARKREEAALEAAEDAQARGDAEVADAILDVASQTPGLSTKPSSGRGGITGASGSLAGRWVGKVVDRVEVCKAIAEGRVSPDVIKDFYASKLNEIAKEIAQEGTFDGIEVKRDEKLSVR